MKSKSLVRLLMTLVAAAGLTVVAYAQEATAPAAEKTAPATEKVAPAAETAAPAAEKVAKPRAFRGKLMVKKDATGKVTAIELKTAAKTVRNIVVDEESTKMAQELDGKRVKVMGTLEGKELKATSITALPAKKTMKKAGAAKAAPKAEATPAEAK